MQGTGEEGGEGSRAKDSQRKERVDKELRRRKKVRRRLTCHPEQSKQVQVGFPRDLLKPKAELVEELVHARGVLDAAARDCPYTQRVTLLPPSALRHKLLHTDGLAAANSASSRVPAALSRPHLRPDN